VVRDISSPLLAEIALGAETTLRAGGYSMLVLNSEANPTIDAEHIRLLERRRVDGVLISLAGEEHSETVAALNELSVPSVLIDRDVPDAVNSSSALVDHESAMHAVVSHLGELGHRVVGLVAGPLAVRPGREGARAFHASCADLGLEALVESGPFATEHGFAAAHRMLNASRSPTAIIAGSNQIFPGVLQAIRQRGLRVPTELSLATFDDLPLLGLLEPPVDVVVRDPPAFGRAAAELLLRRLAGGEPETILVTPQFVRRGSSASPSSV
jgi:LacI family transcriptional regulator